MPLTHIHKALQISENQLLRVDSDQAVKVYLLDHTNYLMFIQDRPYEFCGKQVSDFPFLMKPPHQGSWDLVIIPQVPGTKVHTQIAVVDS